jgi:hypothetical protein
MPGMISQLFHAATLPEKIKVMAVFQSKIINPKNLKIGGKRTPLRRSILFIEFLY